MQRQRPAKLGSPICTVADLIFLFFYRLLGRNRERSRTILTNVANLPTDFSVTVSVSQRLVSVQLFCLLQLWVWRSSLPSLAWDARNRPLL